MMVNLLIILCLMIVIYIVMKKLKFSKPMHFTLLMALVFMSILWVID